MPFMKHCPRCESTSLDVWDQPMIPYYRVKCLDCRYVGPGAVSRNEAIQQWNQLKREDDA